MSNALNPIQLAFEAGKLASANETLANTLMATAEQMARKDAVWSEISLESDVIAYTNDSGAVSVLKVGLLRDSDGEIQYDEPDENGNVYAKARKTFLAYSFERTSKQSGKTTKGVMFRALHGNNSKPKPETPPEGTDNPPTKKKKGTDL